MHFLLETIFEISNIGKWPTVFVLWLLSFLFTIGHSFERVVGGVLSFFFGILIIGLAIFGAWTLLL